MSGGSCRRVMPQSVCCMTIRSMTGAAEPTRDLASLAEQGEFGEHVGGDATAHVADDGGVAGFQTEHVRGIDARVDAAHDERPQPGKHRQSRDESGSGEVVVAFGEGVDHGHVGPSGSLLTNVFVSHLHASMLS